jgi:ATP-dependent Lhr-like helicase
LELPFSIPAEKIRKLLYTTKAESLFYLLNTILKNSNYIRWQLIHIARKFGALRKDFDYRNVGIKKLFTLFDNSLILDETIDKIIWERMDIVNTQKVLGEIQKGKIAVHIQRLSPMSRAGLDTIRGLMAPQRADKSILMALKNRLEETKISFACINCNNVWNTMVKRVEARPRCSKCGAIKIAVLGRKTREYVKLLNKKNRSREETREVKRLHKNASLILSYGKPAVYALVGRGIGPDTAARIMKRHNMYRLNKFQDAQIKLLGDILKAELNYARTRGFWDNN